MRSVEIAELTEMENINLSSVFAMEQVWREGRCFVMDEPRPTNALLWFCGCEGSFQSFDGETVVASRGSLVYIPQGARYEVKFSCCDVSPNTLLAEFKLADSEEFVLAGGIRVLHVEADSARIFALFKKLVFEYALPSKPTLKLWRDMYGLLSLVCESEKYRHFDRRSFQTVKKGVEYLQKDERQELSVDEIAKMCFVTPAYFRRLFKEYSGRSPSQYRIERKMERAKELMERSDISVGELSRILGYDDPSYFCRVFKKTVGMSPSEYRKSIEKR